LPVDAHTASAKPAITALIAEIHGQALPEDLAPTFNSGIPASAAELEGAAVVAVLLSPDGLVIAQERNGRPFRNAGLRPIQMSNPNVLGILIPLGAAEQ